MSEDFPRIQLSRMIGKDQFVIRGDDPETVRDLAAGLAKEAERIAENLNVVQQVVFAKSAFADESNKSSGSSSSSNKSSGSGKSCSHGEMEKRTGKKANGKGWTGYFCPEKECEVVWG